MFYFETAKGKSGPWSFFGYILTKKRKPAIYAGFLVSTRTQQVDHGCCAKPFTLLAQVLMLALTLDLCAWSVAVDKYTPFSKSPNEKSNI